MIRLPLDSVMRRLLPGRAGAVAEARRALDGLLAAGPVTPGYAPAVGGRRIEVTTLAASGPGSLREALAQEGRRHVVFRCAGVIDLKGRPLYIARGDVMISGQSAPMPGITIAGSVVVIGSRVSIKHLAVAPGSGYGESDGISILSSANDVVIDHCDIRWAVDENIGIKGNTFEPGTPERRILISNCIIGEALRNSVHSKGDHSMGLLVGEKCNGVRIIGNLFAHNDRRNPRVKAGSSVLIAGNVIYNPGRGVVALGDNDAPSTSCTVIYNVFKAGPDTSADRFAIDGAGSVVEYGNLLSGRFKGVTGPGLRKRLHDTSFWSPPPSMAGLEEAVLREVGARSPIRSPWAERIVRDVQRREGQIIDDSR